MTPAELTATERAVQGLPPTVRDPEALRRLAIAFTKKRTAGEAAPTAHAGGHDHDRPTG